MAAAGGQADIQTDIIRELDDDLTCSICLELMTDARMLKCAHTFCLTCMSGLITEKYTQHGRTRWYIRCPHCRADTDIPQGKTVADLPRPLPLQKLAELREKISAFVSSASTPSGVYNGNCDVCESRGHLEVNAVVLCVNCDTELCDPCRESHNQRFEEDNHHVRPLTNSDACATHPQKKVTNHCVTCNMLLCPLCVMAPHDPNHILSDIGGQAAEKRKEIQAEVSEVKLGTMNCGNLRAMIKAQKGDINNISKAVRMKIESQRDALKQQIDNEAELLQEKVEELRVLGLQQLDVYLQDTEATIASKLSLLSLAEELTTSSSDSELLGKADDLLQLLQEERELKTQDCVLQLPFYTQGTVEQDISVGGVKPMTRRVSIAKSLASEEIQAQGATIDPARMTSDPRPGTMTSPLEEPLPAQIANVSVLQPSQRATRNAASTGASRSPQQVLRQSQSTSNVSTAAGSPGPQTRQPQRPVVHPSPRSPRQRVPQQMVRSRSDSLEPPRRGSAGSASSGSASPAPSPDRPAFVLRFQAHIQTNVIKDLKVSSRHRRIYVSTRNPRQPVQLFDFSGRRIGHFGTGISSPWGVCHADRHNLVAVCDGNAFHLFHQADLKFYKTVTAAHFQNMMFCTYCEDLGLFAFTDSKDKSIHFVDARTFKVARRINLGDSRSHILPWSIAYTNQPRPSVVVNDVTSTNKRIYVLDMDGRCQKQLANPGPYERWNPLKCRVDATGNIVVVDSETDRLGRFVDRDQSLWHNLLTGENLSGGRPEHCDLTRDGVLAVGCNSHQGGYVHVFNSYQ